MKLVASDIKYLMDDVGNMQLIVVIDKALYHNQNIARRLVSELKSKKLDVSIKEHKSQRSIDQNNMLWALISKLSDHINGSHREEDMMRIYADLLKQANVKRDYFRGLKESIPYFESIARAVVVAPNSEKIENGKTTIGFWCYWGSSTFNVSEMTQLIELSLDRCSELGLDDSEIYDIKHTYKGNV